jgi:hypothetical protein
VEAKLRPSKRTRVAAIVRNFETILYSPFKKFVSEVELNC